MKTWLALALAAAPAAAEQPSRSIDALDFAVEWPHYVGTQVTVLNGRIVGASLELALLKVPGGFIALKGPWKDREDLRYLLTRCAGLLTDRACDLKVTGLVRKDEFADKPELTEVDFETPSK